MTVGELKERMSGAELASWRQFDRIHPLPDPWRQTAEIVAMILNVALAQGQKHPTFRSPAEFVPVDPEAIADEDDGEAFLAKVAGAFGVTPPDGEEEDDDAPTSDGG